ncbi:hypothetical protein Bca52824_039759 [Brassica carinata]|uniref:Uncharacterized protein n=1 Tax=Brassica carinata TaxID=52824 RepID=A0A8X7RRS1_BRACI|nr:hypothetical protein Bca52824_039759 [Brassica carinata]
MRITTNLVIRDQNGDFSRNLRQPIHLLPKKTSKRYAMDSRGINDLNTQDIGQHLDENQKLMLDAFRSGKSGEKGQISVSKTRKSLTFEDNSSAIAVEDLKSAEDTLHKEADVPKEADIKETSDHVQLGLTDADLDMEEDDQLEENDTYEVMETYEGKGHQATKKKLVKAGGVFMGGTTKKRIVQSLFSPKKKLLAK